MSQIFWLLAGSLLLAIHLTLWDNWSDCDVNTRHVLPGSHFLLIRMSPYTSQIPQFHFKAFFLGPQEAPMTLSVRVLSENK